MKSASVESAYFQDIRRVTRNQDTPSNVDLARQRDAGDPEAVNALVVANLSLVVTIARRFRDRGLSLDDLIAEGNIGLIRAAELFDPERDIRFATYATHWIKQAIRRALLGQTRVVYLPHYLYELVNQYRKAGGPTPATVNGAMSLLGIARQRAENLVAALDTLEAWSHHDSDSEDGGLVASLESREMDPVVRTIDHETAQRIQRAVDTLPDRDAEVVRRRFGLDGEPEELQSQLAERFGFNHHGSIRFILKRSLRDLSWKLQDPKDNPDAVA